MLNDQFFGRTFFWTLALHAASFGLAAMVFQTALSSYVLGLLAIAVFALSLKSLSYGLFVGFAELFAHAHGHIIFVGEGGEQIGPRMVIFVAVMLAFFMQLAIGRLKLRLQDPRLMAFVPLCAAIILGGVIGLASNSLTVVLADMNAYFYLAYLLPILCIEWNGLSKRALLQILAGSAVWVMILTLGILFVFSHVPAFKLPLAYAFIRDTRSGELTLMVANVFRVFLQSQFYIIIFLCLLAPWFWIEGIGKRTRLALSFLFMLGGATVLISLSRSFWVGLMAAAIVMLVFIFRFVKTTLKQSTLAMGTLAVSESSATAS